MYFKRDRFSGIAPGVSPRLIADQFAQRAENIDFESGRLAPTTSNSSSVHTLQTASRRSIFYYRSTNWLEWTADGVKAVPGPIPNDTNERLYFTGDGYPKMGTVSSMVSGSSGYPATVYRLGVPAADTAPGVAKSGSVASEEIAEDRTYVYTFVTAYGEEGPPSRASGVIQVTSTESVTVTMPSSELPGTSSYTNSSDFNMGNGALKRIYRSNTGSNFTSFQFVAEVAISATSFSDTVATTSLGEVLPSGTWIGPPDDNTSLYPDGQMQGLCSVGNGVFAGFSGKRFCLSEPYLPHAWPIGYRITLEEDIKAIAATGNGVVALTEGTPYFITGTDPSAMTPIQVDLAQACVNTNSVVDMGQFVLYAAPDGLVAVSNTSGQVVTRGLISAKQWNADFKPTLIRAFRHEDTYVAFYNDGGTLGGWVYDPRADEAALSTLTVSAEVRGGYMDPKDGQLYVIEANTVKKYQGGSSSNSLIWKSKKFLAPSPISMAWVSVHAEAYPVTVKVYGDGALIAHYAVSKSGSVQTFVVTVVNSGGNKYVLDGGSPAAVLSLQRGGTYTFDQSDNTNSNHPLRFKDASGNSYISGVTANGTPGQAGANVVFQVPADAPDSLRYYCTVHGNGMGNVITVTDSVYAQATTVPSGISSGTLQEPIMRLPAKVATEWEVEVSGAVLINEVCLAQSMDEIRGL